MSGRRDSISDRRGDRGDSISDRRDGRTDDRGDRRDDRGDSVDDRRDGRRDGIEDRRDGRQDGIEDRRDNRQDGIEDRRDGRQDRVAEHSGEGVDDWQDWRDATREDWQSWYDSHYDHYGDWHHGYAPGYYPYPWYPGAAWNYWWDNYPVASAFAVTGWAVNRLSYAFGYYPYYNPYYVTTPATVVYSGTPVSYYDYSQPLVVYEQPGTTVSSTTIVDGGTAAAPSPGGAGLSSFDRAREAFFRGDYLEAMNAIDETLKQYPDDAVVHEFRALVLFAIGDYQQAAAAMHAVLAVGPGWDWTTMISLYPSVDIYTSQLRQLESYVRQNPNQADGHFLLGYHYLTCGHDDAAAKQFRKAEELTDSDRITSQLSSMVAPPAAGTTEGPALPPLPDADSIGAKPTIDQLYGTWTASKPDGSKFTMTLKQDGTFEWTFARDSQTQTVAGVFGFEDNVLALEPNGQDGAVMVAGVGLADNGELQFHLIGGDPGDPGLSFARNRS